MILTGFSFALKFSKNEAFLLSFLKLKDFKPPPYKVGQGLSIVFFNNGFLLLKKLSINRSGKFRFINSMLFRC